ncbi:antitoxin HicB [Herbaspirillum sp. Sphag1AN]|uniref:type II toxin-antitoxin system HicB family antitoxin n=1 Tax=unclassified Herbaspirillum TaxID=2624150 RepID=UPI00161A3A0D|nr:MULTISPECIES: type II toxin-antitoxin system HicB family antitoxin [unclassified Herbaspirillum]MBB3213435.1 antitoxin HicB [Herbaspirillum sp. Sphag1AN]MBB3246521.1 antitoxin HicB [Herbaspirillum sp. Sphag64]
MKYPAQFEPDEEAGGFVVTFRDIPEAITQGDTEEEALAMAADVLLHSMEVYFDEKRQVPAPSKARKGERLIDLPASVSAKILLLNEMVAADVWSSELARRMGTTPQEVNRLIDLKHTTKIDRIEEALAALGKCLELSAA